MTKARDLANASTALSAVDATELGYLDGVTSAVQTQLNAKQPTVANVSDTEIGYLDGVTSGIQTQLDAKAVYPSQGGNSGKYLTTNGSITSWGAVASAPDHIAGKNFIINGNFDIFQRTSFASQTTTAYSLDRWYSAVGGTVTVTQQTTGAPVGSQYCMRTAYNAASSFANQHNTFESSTAKVLAGQTVTFSVLIRANASYVGTSSQGIQIAIDKNSTANTASGGSWSTISFVNTLAATIPTGTGVSDWYKVTVTAAIPNDGTANGLRVRVGELVAGPSGAYWEMAQAQLEIGSTATPFSRAGGSIGAEQDLCERYLPTITGAGNYYVGGQRSSTNAIFPIAFRVQPRVAPTGITISTVSDFFMFNSSLGGYTPTSIVYNTAGLNTGALDVGVSGGTGAATGDAVFFRANANSKILFTGCEL